MRGFLADYSIDLEVYDYWLWRYYPDWIDWYRNQQSQTGDEASAETAMQQGTDRDAANAGRDAATAAGDGVNSGGDYGNGAGDGAVAAGDGRNAAGDSASVGGDDWM